MQRIRTSLTGIYFSFDIAVIGFDPGIWKGPFDPDTGLTVLDDDTYQLVVRAKIGASRWDGTLEQSAAILNSIFGADTHVFIEDHQDMSMTIGISGKVHSAVFLAPLAGGLSRCSSRECTSTTRSSHRSAARRCSAST